MATADPGVLRPLAVVMVMDPTPLTVTNLRQLSQWCDLVLTEGTTSLNGTQREPLRDGWREILDLEPPRLRVVTTDLGGGSAWPREGVQRDSVRPVLFREQPGRVVMMADADEFLEPDKVLKLIAGGFDEPVRLGLVPLYGGVDRTARGVHCCWKESRSKYRDASFKREPQYLFHGPSVATAAMMRGRSPSGVRFKTHLVSNSRTFGVHVTMCSSAEAMSVKLSNLHNSWSPRVLDVRHLETMLSAGVHHAGWWICDYREPEPWLTQLAAEAGLRVCGPIKPTEHLRALRAWAQARIDPLVPDEVVTAIDAYVAHRAPTAIDFLPALDEWLLERPVTHSGALPPPDVAVE